MRLDAPREKSQLSSIARRCLVGGDDHRSVSCDYQAGDDAEAEQW